MNELQYYNRQKEKWDDKEISNLRAEYEMKEMTISQIADIHHRTPGCISYKLKNLGIITHNTLSRGYLEYKNSNLYNEIVKKGKLDDAKKAATKKIKNEVLISVNNDELSGVILSAKIVKIENEISSIKNDIKEILRLMNAVYDFENQ